MSACKHCGATLRWVVMESGRRMPCDPIEAARDATGALVGAERVDSHGITFLRHGWVITPANPARDGCPLYKPHWATCPSIPRKRK